MLRIQEGLTAVPTAPREPSMLSQGLGAKELAPQSCEPQPTALFSRSGEERRIGGARPRSIDGFGRLGEKPFSGEIG